MKIKNKSIRNPYVPHFLVFIQILDLVAIMSKPGTCEELQYVWRAWRDASGGKMKTLFLDYVKLSNAAARANGKLKILNLFVKRRIPFESSALMNASLIHYRKRVKMYESILKWWFLYNK